MTNFSSTFDSTYATFGEGRFDIISDSKLARIIHYAGQSVLDVGCGPGRYMQALSDRGYVVAGVKGNEVFAETVVSFGFSVWRLDLDVVGLTPIENCSFETVMALDVLEHLQNPEKVLREMVRVCRKNVLVSVPAATPAGLTQEGLVYASYVDPTHRHYYKPDELEDLLWNVGLVDVEVFATMSTPPVLACFFPRHLQPVVKLLGRILLHAMIPKLNWAVLFAVGKTRTK